MDSMPFRDYVVARQSSLLRTAWLLTGDWHSAEDLVQTTLIKVWPHWARVCRAGDPEGYVRRVLVNVYISSQRRLWRRETTTASNDLPEASSAEDVYADIELRAAILEMLSLLPARQRAVIVLRFYEDLPVTQVAQLLNCTVGTVKSQTWKALQRLSLLWQEEDSHGKQ